MLRFLTAGESHGKALVVILEGVPAGLAIDFDAVTAQLRRRQGGYGRGRRMAIESDRAEALSGIRHGVTTGAPVALLLPNKDWDNWQRTMQVGAGQPADASGVDRPAVTRPRPGHADLAGAMKSDRARFAKYFHGMLAEGIYFAPSQFEAGFLSTAHTAADIEQTVTAAAKVMRTL